MLLLHRAVRDVIVGKLIGHRQKLGVRRVKRVAQKRDLVHARTNRAVNPGRGIDPFPTHSRQEGLVFDRVRAQEIPQAPDVVSR